MGLGKEVLLLNTPPGASGEREREYFRAPAFARGGFWGAFLRAARTVTNTELIRKRVRVGVDRVPDDEPGYPRNTVWTSTVKNGQQSLTVRHGGLLPLRG
jgi:hypothetical protein